MNQQRSRRFRASKEGAELVEEKKRIREEVIQRGGWSTSLYQMYGARDLSWCDGIVAVFNYV